MASVASVDAPGLVARRQRWERATGWLLTVLAFAGLAAYIVTAAAGTSPWWSLPLTIAIWLAFAVDLGVRLLLTPPGRRWLWVRGHPLDVAAVALPQVRLLRAITVISRVVFAAQRNRAERMLLSTATIAGVTTITAAAAVLNAERASDHANITTFGEALWWSLETVTTVGYGDYTPVTQEGRVIGAVLMVVGIGVFGALIGAVTSRVMSPPDRPGEREV